MAFENGCHSNRLFRSGVVTVDASQPEFLVLKSMRQFVHDHSSQRGRERFAFQRCSIAANDHFAIGGRIVGKCVVRAEIIKASECIKGAIGESECAQQCIEIGVVLLVVGRKICFIAHDKFVELFVVQKASTHRVLKFVTRLFLDEGCEWRESWIPFVGPVVGKRFPFAKTP